MFPPLKLPLRPDMLGSSNESFLFFPTPAVVVGRLSDSSKTGTGAGREPVRS